MNTIDRRVVYFLIFQTKFQKKKDQKKKKI